MISPDALIALFQQALDDKWGYIWGQSGTLWTESDQKMLEKTTDSDRAQGRKYGSKWIGHRVADCSGLFSWAFKSLGGYMYHGSDTMYRKYCEDHGELNKGKRTDGKTLKPGTAVFVWNGKSYSHVGLFIGDGKVIEAMSTLKGVTTSKVTDSKWAYWGELKGVDFSLKDMNGSGELINLDDPKPVLKRGSKGKYVKEAQQRLKDKGYDLGPCGVDGDFGKATEKAVKAFQKDTGLKADGIIGGMTWAMLLSTPTAQEPVRKYQVTVTDLDLDQAKDLCNKYKNATYKEMN